MEYREQGVVSYWEVTCADEAQMASFLDYGREKHTHIPEVSCQAHVFVEDFLL